MIECRTSRVRSGSPPFRRCTATRSPSRSTEWTSHGRPSTEDLRRDLRAVTREIRPDWDPQTPGLRQAWEAGDRSSFYHDEDLDPSLRAG